LPWQDTAFFKKLEFVDQKKTVIQEFKEAPIHDFIIDDIDKTSHNQEIIGNPNWQFILVSYDLDETNKDAYTDLNALAKACKADSISFIGLSGSDWTKIDYFRLEIKAEFDFYTADGTALKTLVRANPGLLLLKEGIVVDKWAWRDVPTYDEFKADQADYMKFIEEVKASKKEEK
jgi:triosephosphate isomerase